MIERQHFEDSPRRQRQNIREVRAICKYFAGVGTVRMIAYKLECEEVTHTATGGRLMAVSEKEAKQRCLTRAKFSDTCRN